MTLENRNTEEKQFPSHGTPLRKTAEVDQHLSSGKLRQKQSTSPGSNEHKEQLSGPPCA